MGKGKAPLYSPLLSYRHTIDKCGMAYADDIASSQELTLDALVIDVGSIRGAGIFKYVIRSLPLKHSVVARDTLIVHHNVVIGGASKL